MIDLFGLGRAAPQSQEEPSTQPAEGPAASPISSDGPKGSHRLWAFLLVLDSLFVIVFGGAVAAKVYQYWKAPSPAPAVARRRTAPPKPAEAPKPPEASPAPPKAPEPAKAAPKETTKASSKRESVKTVARADSPRPPKPSMITEPPKPHAAPGLATAGAATGGPIVPPAAASSTKAQPVVFQIRAGDARSVQLVGAFIVHGGRKEMVDHDGVWSVKLYLNRGQYRYFFAVDKKKTLDPENPRSDRGASLLTVP